MSEFLAVRGDPEVISWLRDHGMNPDEITPSITLQEDGSLLLERYMGPKTRATEAVEVRPLRPFPF
ncbi:hypothetical protein [Iamia sp.]|uniref:hypothetical protein n=1 Tax=Iamia sp. TaxID=2722710 RepID=UPI002C783C6E|nr:hypothetical protein [Iamia sp.]HXH57725.1 hypothetical protein [Iamia sp.]